MRLDYKILWIEDDEGWRNSIKLAIENHIRSKGFNPIIEIPDRVTSSDIDKEAFKDFDLLLIDYMLKPMSKNDGDYLIEKIREHKIFTNIVFYSSDLSKLSQEKLENLNNSVAREETELEIIKFTQMFLGPDLPISSILQGRTNSDLTHLYCLLYEAGVAFYFKIFLLLVSWYFTVM